MINLKIFAKNPQAFSAAWAFVTLSFAFSTWVIYIPYIKDRLQLDEGDLGFALFFAALGGFMILPFTGILLRKFGDGPVTFYSTLLFCIIFLMPLNAPSYPLLCAALLLVGMSSGVMDISMNALVSTLEKEEKIFIMSGSHGFFSLGGMVGAGVGALIIPWLNHPQWHAFFISLFLILSNIYLRKYNFHRKGLHSEQPPVHLKNLLPMLGLVIMGLFAMIGEGAVADWSAIFLKEEVMAEEMYWGLGFAGFSFTMAGGRFLGDGLSRNRRSFEGRTIRIYSLQPENPRTSTSLGDLHFRTSGPPGQPIGNYAGGTDRWSRIWQ